MKDQEWKESIEKELNSHKKLGTWTKSKLLDGKTAIDCKWVFKIKEDGIKKSRLVAKGYQISSEDLLDVLYAPVARMATIRLLIAHAVQEN